MNQKLWSLGSSVALINWYQYEVLGGWVGGGGLDLTDVG
jgi:hypothetical protein